MAENSKGDLRGSSATTKQPDAGTPSASATKREATEIYHVVGPGSLMRTVNTVVEGKPRRSTVMIPPGELLELTSEEAAAFGAAVAIGEPPPPPPKLSDRKAGQYRVKGPGSVMFTVTTDRGGGKTTVQTKMHPPGTILPMTAEQARKLGDVLEAV